MLKEDSAIFKDIPLDELTDRLLHKHNFTNGHLEVLAELFNAEAELRLAKDDKPGSLEYSQKSLRLFEFIDAEYKTYSQERIDKIAAIKKRIKTLENV